MMEDEVYQVNLPLRTVPIKLHITKVVKGELKHELSDFEKWLMDEEDE